MQRVCGEVEAMEAAETLLDVAAEHSDIFLWLSRWLRGGLSALRHVCGDVEAREAAETRLARRGSGKEMMCGLV